MQNQAFQASAIAPFLRYASELASPGLTILATKKKIKTAAMQLTNFFF